MLRLNRIRIDSKHHGGQPPRDECTLLLTPVKAFFEEVSAQYIGVHFTTISLVDMLTDNAIKSFLQAAENSLNQGAYESCLIECRKAIFMQFEKHYDAGMYPRKGGLNL